MTKKEARIEALKIARTVMYELGGSDCTENLKVKEEIKNIALKLDKMVDRLEKEETKNG